MRPSPSVSIFWKSSGLPRNSRGDTSPALVCDEDRHGAPQGLGLEVEIIVDLLLRQLAVAVAIRRGEQHLERTVLRQLDVFEQQVAFLLRIRGLELKLVVQAEVAYKQPE